MLDYELKFFCHPKDLPEDFQSLYNNDSGVLKSQSPKSRHQIDRSNCSVFIDDMLDCGQNSFQSSPREKSEKDSSEDEDSFIKGILPLSVDSLNLIDIGKVIDRYPFYDGNNIWPIGYKCECLFYNIENPESQSVYLNSTYLDKNNNLVFSVEKQDNHGYSFVGYSPDDCWIQVKELLAMRHKGFYDGRANGITMFGLDDPVIRDLLLKKIRSVQEGSLKKSKKRRYNKRKRNDHNHINSIKGNVSEYDWKRTKTINDSGMKGVYSTFPIDSPKINSINDSYSPYTTNDTTLKHLFKPRDGEDYLKRKEEAFPSINFNQRVHPGFLYTNKGTKL